MRCRTFQFDNTVRADPGEKLAEEMCRFFFSLSFFLRPPRPEKSFDAYIFYYYYYYIMLTQRALVRVVLRVKLSGLKDPSSNAYTFIIIFFFSFFTSIPESSALANAARESLRSTLLRRNRPCVLLISKVPPPRINFSRLHLCGDDGTK